MSITVLDEDAPTLPQANAPPTELIEPPPGFEQPLTPGVDRPPSSLPAPALPPPSIQSGENGSGNEELEKNCEELPELPAASAVETNGYDADTGEQRLGCDSTSSIRHIGTVVEESNCTLHLPNQVLQREVFVPKKVESRSLLIPIRL
jgi:hypothetical protein